MYLDIRLPVFDNNGRTLKQVSMWNHTYIKVHPNGAAVCADDELDDGWPESEKRVFQVSLRGSRKNSR